MSKETPEQRRELANTLSKDIEYDFFDYYLVKPMPKIKVMKEFSKPIAEENKKSDDDIQAIDYDKVETETKEVDSDFRRGIVLKLPKNYKGRTELNEEKTDNVADIKIGDIILFRDRSYIPFDLLKDSMLIKHWDIIAIVND